MAINDKLIVQEAAADAVDTDNLMLDLDASDVDSYDGDGDVWYDIHDFEYKPTTNVAQNFNTVLYTGDANTVAQPITGAGFTPDLVWIKTIDQATRHILTDSIRGVSSQLFSNEILAAQDYAEFTSFDNDGFTVKRNTGSDYLNQSGIDYVAWCFKAGGAPSGSDKVSIGGTSYADEAAAGLTAGNVAVQKLSVNNDLGFSIVKFNSAIGNDKTVAHGLGQKPELIISKVLVSGGWANWHKSFADPDQTYIPFTGSVAIDYGSSLWNYSNWGQDKIGFDNVLYGSNNDVIAYCFTSKRGVSKVGSYTGTGAAGNRVYTGFEPAFLMFKFASGTGSGDWIMLDNKRDTTNPNSARLDANSSGIQYTGEDLVDFNRDGFTLVTASDSKNGNGDTFIYYAVAKNTNETSLIAGTNLELGLDAGTYSGSGNWLDSSGNSNDGTITGATWEQELGNFFDFNGTSNYVSFASNPVAGTGDFSISTWNKCDNLSGYQYIAQFGSIASNGSGFVLGKYDTNEIYVHTGGWHQKTTHVAVLGVWTHYAVTQTGTTIKFYVNGELHDTLTAQYSPNRTNNNSALGYYTEGNANYWNGAIGQVRLYSTVLSIDDVRQNFNFTKPRYPNEFHGAITGASFVQASGGEVDHFLFDGVNDYITIDAKSSSPVNFSNDFTISVWVNPTVINATHQIFTKYGSTTALQSVTLGILVDGKVNSTLKNSSASVNLRGVAGAVTTSGGWYHIVLVREGTNNNIYINQNTPTKSAYATNTSPLVNTGGTQPIIIGGQTTGTTNEFDGFISKVKLYNAALTTTQITALYNEGE